MKTLSDERRIKRFLNKYKSNTKISYGSAVNHYLSFIYNFPVFATRKEKSMMEVQRNEIENLADRYFTERRNYYEDLDAFNGWCKERFAPMTCQYYYSALRKFLIKNGVVFNDYQKDELKTSVSRGGARTIDHFLTREDLKKILMHANLKLKALILFQVSSGLRPGEVLSLELDDLELFDSYGKITIRGEKSKNNKPRITFCSREAVGYVKEWLSVRDDYLSKVLVKTRGKFQINQSKLKNRVFPFSDVLVRTMLKNALTKADLYKIDKSTKRATIHPHLFRKYFETELYRVINPKVIEKLVGHESELSKIYVRFDEKTMLDEYRKGEHLLTILSDDFETIARTKEEMLQNQEKIKETGNQIASLRLDNLELKQQMTEKQAAQERMIEKMQMEMDTLKKIMAYAEEKKI